MIQSDQKSKLWLIRDCEQTFTEIWEFRCDLARKSQGSGVRCTVDLELRGEFAHEIVQRPALMSYRKGKRSRTLCFVYNFYCDEVWTSHWECMPLGVDTQVTYLTECCNLN